MRLMVDCWHLVGGQLPHVCVCLRLRAKANGNLPSNGLVSFVYSKDDQFPGPSVVQCSDSAVPAIPAGSHLAAPNISTSARLIKT